ncbi:unnamed protein product, partial [Meganyctiphanes norvegica]
MTCWFSDEDDCNGTGCVGGGSGSGGVDCTCGKPNWTTRIVGGSPVDPKLKYPWMVGIYSYSWSDQYYCGGTIVNNLFILSAAHCFYSGGPQIPSDILMSIGDHNQDSTSDDIDGITIKVSVERVHIHPYYDDATINHDFSLVQLSEPLIFGDLIRPVCLPENDLNTYEGETGTIIGWGTTASGGYAPDVLREAQVTILDQTCGDYDPADITEIMLCASHPGTDSCQGDSGGSIAVVEGELYVQVGVVSWGYGCADASFPGVYSRISTVLRWIHQIADKGEWCPRE